LNKSGGYRSRVQPVCASIPGSEEKFAILTLEPVAREVQEEHVVAATVGEEVINLGLRLVRQVVTTHFNIDKTPDIRIAQDLLEGFRIGRRGQQAP
jgi:hypothetical protein